MRVELDSKTRYAALLLCLTDAVSANCYHMITFCISMIILVPIQRNILFKELIMFYASSFDIVKKNHEVQLVPQSPSRRKKFASLQIFIR